MVRSLTSMIGAFAATTALVCAGQAVADPAYGDGYTAHDAPLGAPAAVEIELTGQVAARCELSAASARMSGLRLDGDGEATGNFSIDCNAPFNLRVQSENGGLASLDRPAGVQHLMPYKVSVDVGTDRGLQNLGWCDAAAIGDEPVGACGFGQAPGGWSSGDAVAIGQTGSLKLQWDRPQGDVVRLGDYSDVITITLEVRT